MIDMTDGSVIGVERRSDAAVASECVIATERLNDVVTYLKVGELTPEEMRDTAQMLMRIASQLAVRAVESGRPSALPA